MRKKVLVSVIYWAYRPNPTYFRPILVRGIFLEIITFSTSFFTYTLSFTFSFVLDEVVNIIENHIHRCEIQSLNSDEDSS
jgi:hypothetical protein